VTRGSGPGRGRRAGPVLVAIVLALLVPYGLVAVAPAGPAGAQDEPGPESTAEPTTTEPTTTTTAATTTAATTVTTAPTTTPVTIDRSVVSRPGQGPSLELLGQTSVTRTNGEAPFSLFVRGVNVTDESQIVVTPHKPLRTVIELESVIGQQRAIPAALPQLARVRFGDLPPDPGTGGRRIDVPASAFLPSADDLGTVQPVELGVVGGQSLITFAVLVSDRYAEQGGQTFTVSWLWRMSTAGPAHEPDGSISDEARGQLSDGGALGCFARIARTYSTLPLTFVPDPELVQAWAELRGPDRPTGSTSAPPPSTSEPAGCGSTATYTGFDDFRELVTADSSSVHEVLAQPYVPIDLPAMAAADLGDEVGRQLTAGYDALTTSLGSRAAITSSTRMVERVDAASLQQLRDRGVNRVVVRADELEPVETAGDVNPGRPTTLALADGPIATAVADTVLPNLLVGSEPPAVRVHRFLAAVALAALERPLEQRGLVLGSDASDHYDAALAQVLDLLSGGEHPLLRLDTLSGYFRAVDEEQGEDVLIQRGLAPIEPTALAFNGATIVHTRNTLASYSQWVGADAAADVVATGERDVLVAEHRGLSADATRRYHDEALRPVNELIGQIHFDDELRVTITANKERIPVQFRNDSSLTVPVQVFLSGAKLEFPEGDVQYVDLPPGPSRQSFLVQAQSSGDTTLRIVVRSAPDGRIPIGESRVRIRNFGFSGIAVWITAGAAVFLAVWWMTHWRRNRRSRAPDPDAARATPTGPIDQPA
jgi:hypothetical protein